MHGTKLDSRGFTLIASLMLMLIMSGVAIGLLMMVNTEGKVGGQDVQNNLAFHAAEGGIEHMTSDLANMFQNIQSPTAAQIAALSADAPPNSGVMSYPVYTLTAATKADGTLSTNFGQITSGPFQGLYAQVIPITLQVTASTFAGAAGNGTVGDEVNMSRTVEVALIPVFQFGVFSESDLSFFAGVNLDFNGRTHTNGDIYLLAGSGATTTFQDKVSAWGNVIRTQLANGNLATAAPAHLGIVDILTTSQGCTPPVTGCRAIGQAEGSVTGGPIFCAEPELESHNFSGRLQQLDYRRELRQFREVPGPYSCRFHLLTTHSAPEGNPNPLKSSVDPRREKYPLPPSARRDSTMKQKFECCSRIRRTLAMWRLERPAALRQCWRCQ